MADIDEKTRTIVREEMENILEPIMDAIEMLARHVGVELSTDEPIEDVVTQPIVEAEDTEEQLV